MACARLRQPHTVPTLQARPRPHSGHSSVQALSGHRSLSSPAQLLSPAPEAPEHLPSGWRGFPEDTREPCHQATSETARACGLSTGASGRPGVRPALRVGNGLGVSRNSCLSPEGGFHLVGTWPHTLAGPSTAAPEPGPSAHTPLGRLQKGPRPCSQLRQTSPLRADRASVCTLTTAASELWPREPHPGLLSPQPRHGRRHRAAPSS